jgi:serine phosphatase RsbU (regulator of sigma subunit)
VKRTIDYIINIGAYAHLAEYQRRKVRLTNSIMLALLAITLVIEVMEWVLGQTHDYPLMRGLVVAIPCFILNRYGHHLVARWLLSVCPTALSANSVAYVTPASLPIPIGIPLILSFTILPTVLFDAREWKHMSAALLLNAAVFLGFHHYRAYFEADEINFDPVGSTKFIITRHIIDGLSVATLFICLSRLVWINYKAENRISHILESTEEQNEELKQSLSIINDQAEHITAGIEYARKLKNALLPHDNLLARFPPDSFVYYQPREVVGGDFFWLHEAKDGYYLAVADCTGHGVPGAMLAALGLSLINQEVAVKQQTNPAKILESLHLDIQEALSQDEQYATAHDGMDIALVHLDLAQKKLTYSGANRPLWLVSKGKVQEIKPTKRGLGGKFLQDVEFELHSFSFKGYSALYLFTDGITDQLSSLDGKKFTQAGLQKLIEEQLQGKPAAVQLNLLEQHIRTWKGTYAQQDDMLLMGISLV